MEEDKRGGVKNFEVLLNFIREENPRFAKKLRQYLKEKDFGERIMILQIIRYTIIFTLGKPIKAGQYFEKYVLPGISRRNADKNQEKKGKRLIAFNPRTGQKIYR